MKRLLQIVMAVAVAAGAMGLTSCGCCTGEDPVPPLRPLPTFESAPVVEYAK
ncbi:MAG: hypothetical protein AAGC74_08995 [Verrucomicrobiota bacterium]